MARFKNKAPKAPFNVRWIYSKISYVYHNRPADRIPMFIGTDRILIKVQYNYLLQNSRYSTKMLLHCIL
jgi:hypothetical protein